MYRITKPCPNKPAQIRQCPDRACANSGVCQHNIKLAQQRDWVRNVSLGAGHTVQVQGERLSDGSLIDFRRKAGPEPFVEPKTKSGLD